MILPETDISIMMVRNALGYPSTDLGTLCTCYNINMWSKKKPVIHNFTHDRPVDWYIGSDRDYGIERITYYSEEEVIRAIERGDVGYRYKKPTGGLSSPYRLGDFAGYYPDAIAPIAGGNLPETIYKSVKTFKYVPLINRGSETQIGYDEFFDSFENTSLVMCIKMKKWGTERTFTSGDLKNDPTSPVQIDCSSMPLGTYTVHKYLKNGSNYHILPYTEVQEVELKESSISIYVSGIQTLNNKVIVTYSGTSAGSSILFTNVHIHLRFIANLGDYTLPLVDGEQRAQVDDFRSDTGNYKYEFTNLRYGEAYALHIFANGSFRDANAVMTIKPPQLN